MLAVGVAVAVYTGLFPPWERSYKNENAPRVRAFILSPPPFPGLSGTKTRQIDFTHLATTWVIIATVTGTAMFTLQTKYQLPGDEEINQ